MQCAGLGWKFVEPFRQCSRGVQGVEGNPGSTGRPAPVSSTMLEITHTGILVKCGDILDFPEEGVREATGSRVPR